MTPTIPDGRQSYLPSVKEYLTPDTRYTEEEPEIYEQEELDKLFAACDAEERLWYAFFLMTGMR
jgi:hypothetical protein